MVALICLFYVLVALMLMLMLTVAVAILLTVRRVLVDNYYNHQRTVYRVALLIPVQYDTRTNSIAMLQMLIEATREVAFEGTWDDGSFHKCTHADQENERVYLSINIFYYILICKGRYDAWREVKIKMKETHPSTGLIRVRFPVS